MTPRRRPPVTPEEIPDALREVLRFGDDAPRLGTKLGRLSQLRGQGAETSLLLDDCLLRELATLHAGLGEAREAQKKLRLVLDKLGAPPHFPALFLGREMTARGPAALVWQGNTRRVVLLGDGVDGDALEPGDEVLLSAELNQVVERSPYAACRGGETAVFDRYVAGDRMVIRFRDEEIVVDAVGELRREKLKPGDRVRWERSPWLAFEKLAASEGEARFLEDTPAETFAEVGGLDEQIARLQEVVGLHVQHPALVGRYELQRKGSVLLQGPPGTGKTMLTRALANWLASLSPSGRARFMNVRPGELNSVWFSQSEKNYREVFRMAREAAEREPAVPCVVFFDEIDALASRRGASLQRIDDRVLQAVFCELDGLEKRGNVLVVGATNRPDALDSAALRFGRLSDLVIDVPRPGAAAARAIFSRHFSPAVPLADDDGETSHQALLDAVVAYIYSEGADAEVATASLRDARVHRVRKKDLMSGAIIRKICVDAKEAACRREADGGPAGVRAADLHQAADREFARIGRLLTPANCRDHVDGLPQDVDVVRVEPSRRRVAQPLSYLRIAG